MGPSAAPWVVPLVACADSPVTLDSIWLVPPVASAVQPLPGQAHPHFADHYSAFLWNPLKMESPWLHVVVTTHQRAQSCALLDTHLRDLECKHAFWIPKVVKYTGQNHRRAFVSFSYSYYAIALYWLSTRLLFSLFSFKFRSKHYLLLHNMSGKISKSWTSQRKYTLNFGVVKFCTKTFCARYVLCCKNFAREG